MKNKRIIILILCMFALTGCTKILKDNDKQIVKNPETGQSLTENIICKPTDELTIETYKENGVNVDELPTCENFSPLNNYEGLWTSIFVKPLAWAILKIGYIVKNFGLAIMLACLIIRLVLYPVTKKTAMQSELMKKAQPEITKLEKKYENKNTPEDQNKKAQEMMLIYQKYKINPLSGCLLAFFQLPLLLAFYEAINRTPAIFEDNLLSINLGKTPWMGIKNGEYIYIIIVIFVFAATYISFRKTLKDTTGQMANMKYTLYFMIALITYSAFTIASAVGIYWVTSNVFTIIQNLMVERKKEKNG